MLTLNNESLSTAYRGHRACVWLLMLLGGWWVGIGLVDLLRSIDENGWGSWDIRWTWQPIGEGLVLFAVGIYLDTRRLPAGTTLAEVRAEQQRDRESRRRCRDSLMRRKRAPESAPAAQGPADPGLRVAAWATLFLSPVLMLLLGDALFPRPVAAPSPASIFVLVVAALAGVACGLELDARSRGGESLWRRLVERVQL